MRHFNPLGNLSSVSELYQYILTVNGDSEEDIRNPIFDRIKESGTTSLNIDYTIILHCTQTEDEKNIINAFIATSPTISTFFFKTIDSKYFFSATIITMISLEKSIVLLLVYMKDELDNSINQTKKKSAIESLASFKFTSNIVFEKKMNNCKYTSKGNDFSLEIEEMTGIKFVPQDVGEDVQVEINGNQEIVENKNSGYDVMES